MAANIRPLHDRVVLRRIEEDTKSAGGIIIPDTAQEKPQQGEVIADKYGQPQLAQRNLDLALLVAYQLSQNWNGQITLCMAVPEKGAQAQAEEYLEQLISLTRLPSTTGIQVFTQPFEAAIKEAPTTDLNIFGLAHEPDLRFIRRMATEIDTSCVFVRDSGEESAMA